MALNSQQIITLATQIAKCPGFTSQAGQILNYVLSELCQSYDFELARATTQITLSIGSSGPYNLPAAFLRCKNREVFYTKSGVVNNLEKVLYADYDWLTGSASNGPPLYFTTDMSASPPSLLVFPPPDTAYVVTVRYYQQMPDITTPETSTQVPWFPNTNYLITRVAGELMKLTNDDRCGTFLGHDDGGGSDGAGSRVPT